MQGIALSALLSLWWLGLRVGLSCPQQSTALFPSKTVLFLGSFYLGTPILIPLHPGVGLQPIKRWEGIYQGWGLLDFVAWAVAGGWDIEVSSGKSPTLPMFSLCPQLSGYSGFYRYTLTLHHLPGP